jgi:hypothetical protein
MTTTTVVSVFVCPTHTTRRFSPPRARRRDIAARAMPPRGAVLSHVTAADTDTAERLMATVYGSWGSAAARGGEGEGEGEGRSEGWSPRPLLKREAAEAPGGQRRYLWTDAFGVGGNRKKTE